MKLSSVDPILLSGTIISVAIAVILVLSGQDEAISLLIGLSVSIISLLIDIIARVEQTRDKLTHTQNLSIELSRQPRLLKLIQDIVHDYSLVHSKKFLPFSVMADQLLAESQHRLRNLTLGRLRLDIYNSNTYGHKGLLTAKKTVKAVAYADLGFWRTDYAQGYMEDNRDLVATGVKITRIWLQSPEAIEQYFDVLKVQSSYGVETLLANPDDVPSSTHLDFMIVDDEFLVTLDLNHEGRPTSEIISIDELDIKQALYNFDLLRRYSHQYNS